MNENKKASEALLQGIKNIVQTEISKAPLDKTVTGIIKSINKDKTYNILIQGQQYDNIPSIFTNIAIDDVVKVKIPQNQYSLMYIEGKINIDIGFTEGFVTSVNGKTGNVVINEDKSYIHTQLNANNIWNIEHNLNKYPSITIVDSGDNIIVGDVTYISNNVLQVEFTYPFTGKAFLN